MVDQGDVMLQQSGRITSRFIPQAIMRQRDSTAKFVPMLTKSPSIAPHARMKSANVALPVVVLFLCSLISKAKFLFLLRLALHCHAVASKA